MAALHKRASDWLSCFEALPQTNRVRVERFLAEPPSAGVLTGILTEVLNGIFTGVFAGLLNGVPATMWISGFSEKQGWV